MKRNLEGGYIGLVILLLSVAFIIFFLIRTDLFLGKENSKSYIDINLEAIDRAEQARDLIEQNNQRIFEE